MLAAIDAGRRSIREGKATTIEQARKLIAQWTTKSFFDILRCQRGLQEGRPGSWRKWYKGGFTEPGLGGRATPILSLAHHSGGNPSVLWNTFRGRWVMVWHRWAGDILISTSENLTDWSPPKLLLGKSSNAGKVWYPTLIGESDLVGGRSGSLLYAEFPDKNSPLRRFLTREIVFRENTHKRNSTKGDGSCAASR